MLPESAVKDKKKTEAELEKEGEQRKLEIQEREKPPVALGGSITIGGQNLDGVDLKWW